MIEGTAWLLVLALLLDAALGEPRWLWSKLPHPAVLMGRAVQYFDEALNKPETALFGGIVTVFGLGFGAILFGLVIASLPLGGLWSVMIAAILIAQKSLLQHVQAVADGLRYGVGEGRRAVGMIVGRDTSDMTQADVARAAIESAAENFSDGVIAPAFWFLIAGLPGIVFYKVINTADSMIGHRTPRYEKFGWAAARLDDVLNWIPARLTAVLISVSYRSVHAWNVVRKDASKHRSPNAGWPEAAMAGVLDIALSGPRSYHGQNQDFPFVNATGKPDPDLADIEAAIAVLWRVWAVALGGVLLLSLF